jgi:hypothetical protein
VFQNIRHGVCLLIPVAKDCRSQVRACRAPIKKPRMKELRDLLMDIRIELRQHVRDFHKTELCRRIDDARDALSRQPAAGEAVTSVEAADRIAQAWQAAAEDLKTIAPPFFELLSKKVTLRLSALPPLPEPVEAAAEDAGAESSESVDVSVDGSRLDAEKEVVIAPSAMASTLGTVDAHIPSLDALQAIAANKRRFSEVQREWCVGEAMVRSGFSIDPEEFIGRGDSEMARYLLESTEEA